MKWIQPLIVTSVFIGAGLPLAYAVKVKFVSDPSAAEVRVVGPAESLKKIKVPSGTTPVELDLPRSSTAIEIVISKPGFESNTQSLITRGSPPIVNISLLPLISERSIPIESEPSGAAVLVNGLAIGKTPLVHIFRFERKSSQGAWSTFKVEFKKEDHQSEQVTWAMDPLAKAEKRIDAKLGRIAEAREIEVVSLDDRGQAIQSTEVSVNGKAAGRTDDKGMLKINLPYRRMDKNAVWPMFKVTLGIHNEYQPVPKDLPVDSPARIEYKLTPVTEVSVKHQSPSIEMTPRGPRIRLDSTESIGVLNERDFNSPAIELRPITSFDRRQTSQAINSFTVTPDGRNLLYALTTVAEDGGFSSNLYLKSVQSATTPVTQLTRGTHVMDSFPTMSGEESAKLVVFQSNRGVADTWNISAIRLDGTRVVGGVQQLTRDTRFNHTPALASEAQSVFFSSVGETPRSPPAISSVRSDGSTLTNHGEVGEMLYCGLRPQGDTSMAVVYFCRIDPTSGKYQIYSVGIDGQAFSTVINDDQLTKANCIWPAVSPRGDMLLFASDYALDEAGRKNNNLFLCDLKKGVILQLTDNGSDDIMPRWSPTEPGVLYFLSNRRGAYNVWQMTFRLAQ